MSETLPQGVYMCVCTDVISKAGVWCRALHMYLHDCDDWPFESAFAVAWFRIDVACVAASRVSCTPTV